MADSRSATNAGERISSGAGRLAKAWRALPPERRLAAYASVGLFLTLFLPWYQQQFFIVVAGKLQPASATETGWAAFSLVEAAVLLVACGVLTLLFQRAEGRAFHIPGGDGWAITIAGFWTSALVIWRIFDKQGGVAHGRNATTFGIEWGILVALGVAALLAYAGSRIRAAHRPEPALPGEAGAREPRVMEPGVREPGPVAPGVRDPGPIEPERRTGWLTAPPRQRTAPPNQAPAGQAPGPDDPLTVPFERDR